MVVVVLVVVVIIVLIIVEVVGRKLELKLEVRFGATSSLRLKKFKMLKLVRVSRKSLSTTSRPSFT